MLPDVCQLLWISAETPDVRGGGGQRRQFYQIKSLVKSGVDVHVATLAGSQDDASLRAICCVRRFRERRFRGLLQTHAVDCMLAELRPDRVVVAHVESAQLVRLEHVRAEGVPVLLDFHNVYSRYRAALGETEESERWRERERAALAGVTVATACSNEEVGALRALGTGTAIELAAHGVEPDEWPDEALASDRGPVLAFFGALGHPPNREGLRWLVGDVWPQIASVVPGARLDVLGPGDAGFDVPAGVKFHGRVEDLAAKLGAARVVAVPILRGVGARVKFVEALASGAAVVSTAIGAEGCEARGYYRRADEPDAFAQACIELLKDREQAMAMGRSARALALQTLRWQQTSAALVAFANE